MVKFSNRRLDEITDSCLGKMLDKNKNRGEYHPYLANRNVKWGHFDLKELPQMRFQEVERERYGLKKGDLIICEGGEPGRCAVWEDEVFDMRIQKALHRVRARDGLNIYYLFYWFLLEGKKGRLEQYFTGTTIKHLPGDKLKSIIVSLPEKNYQDRIVTVLNTLDQKIKLNDRINGNLLQQAMAVFDTYYIASMKQASFTDLIRVLGGGTPKTGNQDFWDGLIPFFTPKDAGEPYTFQTEKYITESGLSHCNSRLYQKDTTFVTARGTVGKVSLAGTPMAMNQSCYALESETVDPLLVYFYAIKAVASLKHKASGAVFDAIVTRDFESETINILSDDDSKSVLSIIKPMMEAIHKYCEENMRLDALRNSLLPKLMSGEMDISDFAF